MRLDVSLLPALAAAFMLVFARIGAMVMLTIGLILFLIEVRISLSAIHVRTELLERERK